ncbi:MAG TPA: class I SAM-dependent methyltransferase [Chryseolinea sp.]|nr:class I SAM-dependent methyltransferase [Chryseolinea sp.]
MEKTQNEKIIQSWNENADRWTNAVRTRSIESRHLVTNDAIIQTVVTCGGTRVLDVGCGEGWLSHELMKKEKDVTGFDVSSNLIEQAKKDSSAKFQVLSYEKFVADPLAVGRDFDVVVCNFSLLGDQLDRILKAMLSITKPSGHLVIQTLHPYSSVGDLSYEDGWREETFQGLSGKWSPMPWYFRTLGSWIRELTSAGWRLNALKEPLHPATGKPASLILEARKK